MPDYAIVKDNRCVATGTLSTLPERPDVIEREGGIPSVGDVLENGTWTTPPAPAPTPDPQMTRLAFMDQFTNAELVAIYTAAKSSVEIEIFLEKTRAAQDINLTDVRTREGVTSLEAAGLIGAGRAAEILGDA